MNGVNYNNLMKKNNQGQILIIVLMLIATTISIVLSLSFKSKVETELTKLEEENQKAMAAAQAGIEAVLKQKTTVIIGSDVLPNSDVEGSAQIENLPSKTFTTPFLKKDEQYTFYLADFDPKTFTFTSPPIDTNLTISFPSSVALELTLLKNDGSLKKRYVLDCNGRINGAQIPSNCSTIPTFIISTSDIGNDSVILIARLLFNQGKITISADKNLPFQGSLIISEVKTAAGVSKKIQLFQSYPQIPAEFFVTKF